MGLLDQPTVTPAKETALRIRGAIPALFGQMSGVFTGLFQAFWKDPVNVAKELGTDGAELFRLAGILTDTLNSAKPNSVTGGVPDGFTVTPNPDGSVTIGQTPAPAPSPTPTPTPAPAPAPQTPAPAK